MLTGENDIETLRTAATLLDAENRRLLKMNVELRNEIRKLQGKEPTQLELQVMELERQLQVRNKMLFGTSSEKREHEKSADHKLVKSPQKGHGPREQGELSLLDQIHVLDEADRTCPQCGGRLQEWSGQFEESEEIDVLARRFVRVVHKRQKYRCSCASCIETAEGPKRLIPGGRYSTDFAVNVAIGKYADHLPLERQVRTMKREGLISDSQTLWNQIEALARVLQPLHARLQTHVLSQPVLGADETHWQMMDKKGSKRWQVWAAAAPDAVYYHIADTRSADAAKLLLTGYSGVVLCDGYAAYESLRKQVGGFRIAHCWAHVRRKFIDAKEMHPKECTEVLDLIAELYAIERDARAGPDNDATRHDRRAQHSRPILTRIQTWALSVRTLPENALGKAIAYLGAMWKGLVLFLDEPHVSLDNNAVERALRGVVLGRKNHYGSRSLRGTEVAALFYSLIESAKLVDIDAHQYLCTATKHALNGEPIPLPHEMKLLSVSP